MKASAYHQEWGDSPVHDKLAEYTESYPVDGDALADLDWRTDEDEIFFYQDVEELACADFTDKALDAAFEGTLKVSHLVAILGMMEKSAKISTQAERAKMRQYRMANKAMIARKAKIRRRKEKSGARRKKKRVGTAAGGYSFIISPPRSSKSSGGSQGARPKAPSQPKGYGDFNPVSNTSSTHVMSTLKVAALPTTNAAHKNQTLLDKGTENKPFLGGSQGEIKNPGVQSSPLLKPPAPMATAQQKVHPDLGSKANTNIKPLPSIKPKL